MKNKNWIGNEISTYATLGASSHSKDNRQKFDYYATEPFAVDLLFSDDFCDTMGVIRHHDLYKEFRNKNGMWKNVWECACGEGHLSKRMIEKHGINVYSSDIVDRGFGHVKDFLCPSNTKWNGDIITNPPYKYAKEFVEKSLSIIPNGNYVAMFLKLQFLEGKGRKEFLRSQPPMFIFVSSSRIKCGKNGDFNAIKSSAVAYCWYIWKKGFKGNPQIKWFN